LICDAWPNPTRFFFCYNLLHLLFPWKKSDLSFLSVWGVERKPTDFVLLPRRVFRFVIVRAGIEINIMISPPFFTSICRLFLLSHSNPNHLHMLFLTLHLVKTLIMMTYTLLLLRYP
jgi:hypothetical protein